MNKIPKSYYLYLSILAFSFAVYFLYNASSVEAPPVPASLILIDESLPAAESEPVVPIAPEEVVVPAAPPELDSFVGLEEEGKVLEVLENSF